MSNDIDVIKLLETGLMSVHPLHNHMISRYGRGLMHWTIHIDHWGVRPPMAILWYAYHHVSFMFEILVCQI